MEKHQHNMYSAQGDQKNVAEMNLETDPTAEKVESTREMCLAG